MAQPNNLFRYSCYCSVCKSVYRIARDDATATITSLPTFCAYCGNSAVHPNYNTDVDYWEILAESYNQSTEVIHAAYDIWHTHMLIDYARFDDYMKHILSAKGQANANED